jgi:hypothetical protein
VLVLGLAAWLTGCATRGSMLPAPSSASARPGVPGETPMAPGAGSRPLPPPVAARSWDDFKVNAGRRLVAAHPNTTYLSDPPPVLFGIPVIETELYVDGTIKSIRVLRAPENPEARDTVQLAIAAIRRAAPYGDMSHLAKPWKWTEVFLFDDRRHFKPQSLDD